MRRAVVFAGLGAIGLILLVAMAGVIGPGTLGGKGRTGLDLGSMTVGLGIGLSLVAVSEIHWASLPRRIVAWVLGNRRSFKLAGWAGLFLAVLIFY